MKTDDELIEVSRLMREDGYGAGLKAYAGLTTDERARMMQLIHEKSEEDVRRVLAEAEADGSMDEIRRLYAQDLVKKAKRKKPQD